MKTTLFTSLLCLGSMAAIAQAPKPPNAFSLQIQRIWDVTLPEPVKLFDVGKVGSDKDNRLVLMTTGLNKDDYKRKLQILRWNGQQFIVDHTAEFIGATTDSLLIAPFRQTTAKPVKGQKSAPPALHQIVTTEGLYTWASGSYNRAFSVPKDARATVIFEKTPAQLIFGTGDSTAVREVTDTDLRPSEFEPPLDGPGYVKLGTGTQELLTPFVSGIRYAQSFWQNRVKWIIGIVPGEPSNLPEAPNTTVRDRVVVLMPKSDARDKSFWATKPTDFEEAWRSEPISGRILDIRIGDPKNDGREGILILTAENKDKSFRLHCFGVTQGILIGR
jgi:hypothetical protein